MRNYIFTDEWDIAPEKIDEIYYRGSVKICSRGERFWVKIVCPFNDLIIGKVENELCIKREYGFNDYVVFKQDNVFDTIPI